MKIIIAALVFVCTMQPVFAQQPEMPPDSWAVVQARILEQEAALDVLLREAEATVVRLRAMQQTQYSLTENLDYYRRFWEAVKTNPVPETETQ
jgi:hypothetical protein